MLQALVIPETVPFATNLEGLRYYLELLGCKSSPEAIQKTHETIQTLFKIAPSTYNEIITRLQKIYHVEREGFFNQFRRRKEEGKEG